MCVNSGAFWTSHVYSHVALARCCWHLTERADAADKRISEVERELVMELSAVDNDAYNAAKVASAVVLLRMIADSEDQQVDRRVREAITVLEEYRCAEGDSE